MRKIPSQFCLNEYGKGKSGLTEKGLVKLIKMETSNWKDYLELFKTFKEIVCIFYYYLYSPFNVDLGPILKLGIGHDR